MFTQLGITMEQSTGELGPLTTHYGPVEHGGGGVTCRDIYLAGNTFLAPADGTPKFGFSLLEMG